MSRDLSLYKDFSVKHWFTCKYSTGSDSANFRSDEPIKENFKKTGNEPTLLSAYPNREVYKEEFLENKTQGQNID